MSLLVKIRKQNAVYWEATTQDQHADYVLLPGVDIKVRWEEKYTTRRTETGEEIVFSSKVFVDRVMPVGSHLLKDTTVAELEGAKVPPESARDIKAFDDVPQLKPTKPHLYIAYL